MKSAACLRYGINAKRCMESSRSDAWNQSEGEYTLARDNQAKRVGKLACQRASADCSASVPSKTEHSTKCRRANGGRARSIPYRRYATDYILAHARFHANPSDWIEKSKSFFNEIVPCTMKSEQARMKSSAYGFR